MTSSTDGMEPRWQEAYSVLMGHPSAIPDGFWDDFYQAIKDLVNGQAETVSLTRQNDQGPIRVEWTPVTLAQRERQESKGGN